MTPLEIYEKTQAEFRSYLLCRTYWADDVLRGVLFPWYGPDGEGPKHVADAFKTRWGPAGAPAAVIPVYRTPK